MRPPRRQAFAAAAPHQVRLIGGQFRRSKLPVADRPGLRPTPDRVRETLFNWLGHSLEGWRCLDAFAGSGALGFEAASRGAAEVVLLERDPGLAAGLRGCQARLGAAAVRVQCADALAWMATCTPERFEIVFIDPPFDAGLHAAALARAVPLVVAAGYVYVEAPEPLATLPEGCTLWRQGRAGSVHYHLLQRSS
jgi:16S rRNA (guanine(966)-N(2))-methyltransferase RsmD